MYHPLCVSGGVTTTASPHTAAECYCCGRTRMCECKLSDETQEKPHCSHVPQLPETTVTTTEVTISKFHKGHLSSTTSTLQVDLVGSPNKDPVPDSTTRARQVTLLESSNKDPVPACAPVRSI